jgi:biotin carboxyl carrier protein
VTFDLDVSGGSRRVEVSGTQVMLDGKPYPVDVARAGPAWSLLVERVDARLSNEEAGAGFSRLGRSYEVFVDERPDGLIVHVNGRPVAVSMGVTRAQRTQRSPASGEQLSGPRRVVAPMPGRVLKVLVKVGDLVTARQGLVVVEAMKMENELRAPAAGTVAEIRAVEGALVDANAVLVVLE